MAGAFDDFTPPSQQGGGAFSGFSPPSSAPSSSGPSQSWPDYLLDHLHSFSQGLNSATRVAQDAATFGLMDKLFGSQAQADTAAAYKQVGGAAIPLSLAGGMATGLPELKAASAIGEAAAPYIGKWAGGVLGSGAVGAGSGAAGAYGHEAGWTPDAGDIEKGAAIGGGLGAAAGTLGGVVGRGGTLPTSPTAQSYFDQAEQAYKPLDNILYDGKSVVHPEIDAAENAIANSTDLTGQQRKLATTTMGIVDDLRARPQLSARDIQSAQIRLNTAANRGTIQDQQFAPQFHDALQNVLEQGVPQTGVPQGAGPGYAAGVKAAGDFLTGQGKDMQRADVWNQVGATPAGKDIGAQAGSWLSDQAARAAANKPGVWAEPGSPYYDATTALAKTTGQPTPLSWYAKHFFLTPLAVTAAGEGLNAVSGGEGTGHQPWYDRMAEEGAAGLALGGGTAAYKAWTGASNVAEQQAAEAALRQSIASRTMQNPVGTYAPIAPIAPEAPWRAALRNLIYGQAARGRPQAGP